ALAQESRQGRVRQQPRIGIEVARRPRQDRQQPTDVKAEQHEHDEAQPLQPHGCRLRNSLWSIIWPTRTLCCLPIEELALRRHPTRLAGAAKNVSPSLWRCGRVPVKLGST